MTRAQLKYQREEKWNAASHGLGFFLAMVGGGIMIINASDLPWAKWWAVLIYVAGTLFVFGSSTAYHSVSPGVVKERLCTIDHISIYFMIAGSQMPILMEYFDNTAGCIIMTGLWLFVLVGILYKLLYVHTSELINLSLYIAMGSLLIFVLPDLLARVPYEVVFYIFLGAFFYLFGIVFYLWESLPFNHPIWHLFVLAGSVTHFVAIYYIVG